MSDDPIEEVSTGNKRNIIVGYKTLEDINLGLQRVELGVASVLTDIADINRVRDDHDVRIRALELAQARQGGALSSVDRIFLSIWPVAGFILGLLAYLNK